MKRLTVIIALAALAALSSAQAQPRIIAWLKPGVVAKKLPVQFPVRLMEWTPSAPFALYRVLPGYDAMVVEAAMRASGLVVMAEDDMDTEAPENEGAGKGGTIGAVFDPGGFYSENAGFLQQINWHFRFQSILDRPVRVAVLDTGAPINNPYIRSRIVAATAIANDRKDWNDMPSGADGNGNGEPDEGVGHGSMVSGIVAQIAPYSKLVIARVADADGTATAWNLIKGLVFACQNGAEVVNISLGSVDGIVALKDIIEGWVDPQGVVVVAPVGNNNHEGAIHPARYSTSVAVAGVDPFDVRAPFSNWDGHTSQSAPATGIKSAWWDGTIGMWSGTSFASPMVAATLADGFRARPRLINAFQTDLLRALVETVGDDIDVLNPGYERKLGLRLNHQNLVEAVIGM